MLSRRAGLSAIAGLSCIYWRLFAFPVHARYGFCPNLFLLLNKLVKFGQEAELSLG